MRSIAAPSARRRDNKQLFLAGALGLMAAVLAVVFLSRADKNTSTSTVDTVAVLVASEPLTVGSRIAEDQVVVKNLPASAVVQDTIRDKSQAIGQVVRYPMTTGDQIGSSRLVQTQKKQLLSYQIPSGYRAMSVPVSDKETPIKLIAPGDFVDVLVTIKIESLTGKSGSKEDVKGAATILQNIQVLTVEKQFIDNGIPYDASVRGEASKEKENLSFVTLAVQPEDAQLLWLAQSEGKLTLILRPFGENKTEQIPFTVETLLLN